MSEMLPPGNTAGTVAALPTLTPPGESTQGDIKIIFHSTIPSASVFRPDGKRLVFLAGYHETNIKEDIEFLDKEIAHRFGYITRANKAEMLTYRQLVNPREAIENEVRANLETTIRAELEDKIRAEMAVGSTAAANADAEKLKTVEASERVAALRTSTALITPVSSSALGASVDSNSR